MHLHCRLVREISQDMEQVSYKIPTGAKRSDGTDITENRIKMRGPFRWRASALKALHEATEMYMVRTITQIN